MNLRPSLSCVLAAGVVVALTGAPVAEAAPPKATSITSSTTIEAENVQSGTDSFSDTTAKNLGGDYRDSGIDIRAGGNGHYVGWTAPDEWIQYDLDFAESGTYTARFRLASNQATARTFRVEIDGTDVSGTLRFTGTDWGEWASLEADLGSIDAGSHQLRIVFGNGKLDVDQFSLTRDTGQAVTTAARGSYPGQPAAGDVHWGAFYRSAGGSMNSAARYEKPASQRLDLRRSYFQWDQRTTSLIREARHDAARGRVPWVSVKTPSWRSMGNGSRNAEIDQMLRALDDVNGPVWLTIHHEPDGGNGVNAPDDEAGPAGHLAMNKQVRQRMTALGVDNVALAPVLMEWTFNPQSGRNPDAYWAPGVYDFLGIDAYSHAGDSLLDPSWQRVRNWAEKRGVDVAVAEYGIDGSGGSSATVMREFYRSAVRSGDDGNGARVVALTVFDSGPKGWALRGAQLTEFNRILSQQ